MIENINFKKSILLSFITKILGLIASYLIIGLTVNCLDASRYGIWVTLLSITSWINFFDVGLGNGLKNKLTIALEKKQYTECRKLVSTAYTLMFLISLIIILVSILIVCLFSFQKIFNTAIISENEGKLILLVFVIFSSINFTLSLNKQIFYALQKTEYVGVTNLLINFFSLFSIIVISVFSKENLLLLSIMYSLSMVFVNLIVTVILFKRKKEVRPCIKYFDKNKIKDIMDVGIQFFIIQLSMLILYTTDNFIITHMLGPEFVGEYNIAYKLFQIVVIMHNIVITPYWAAFTSAYSNGNIDWIKDKYTLLKKYILVASFSTIVIFFLRNFIVHLWVGPEYNIDFNLAIFMVLYNIVFITTSTWSYILNGLNEVKLQMYLIVFGAIINIPTSILFCKILGVPGIIFATTISLLLLMIIAPLQINKILKNNALLDKKVVIRY